MDSILSKILEAVWHLIIAFCVYKAWDMAYEKAIKDKFWNVLGKGLLICFIIAFGFSVRMGQDTCAEREFDGQQNVCIEYNNDGYETTNEEKYAEFAYYFILFYIPVILGSLRGKKEGDFNKSFDIEN